MNRRTKLIRIAFAVLGVSALLASAASAQQSFKTSLSASVAGASQSTMRTDSATGVKMLTVASGQKFKISMADLANADRCVMLSPASVAGTGWARNSSGKREMGEIGPDHPWYPRVGEALVVKVACISTAGVQSTDEIRITRQ